MSWSINRFGFIFIPFNKNVRVSVIGFIKITGEEFEPEK